MGKQKCQCGCPMKRCIEDEEEGPTFVQYGKDVTYRLPDDVNPFIDTNKFFEDDSGKPPFSGFTINVDPYWRNSPVPKDKKKKRKNGRGNQWMYGNGLGLDNQRINVHTHVSTNNPCDPCWGYPLYPAYPYPYQASYPVGPPSMSSGAPLQSRHLYEHCSSDGVHRMSSTMALSGRTCPKKRSANKKNTRRRIKKKQKS